MEGDSLYGERFSIRDSARSLKKYGSTCNHVRNTTNDALIKHDVQSADTLQGIALKYGCTTEQIRRTNRLYASDSLFSKPYLMVPVSKGSPYYPADEGSSSSSATDQRPQSMPLYEQQRIGMDNGNSFSGGPWDPLQAPGPSSSCSMDFPSTSSSSVATPAVVSYPEELSPEEEQKKSIDELLGKIDSTIANSRRFVAKSQDARGYRDEANDSPDGNVDYDGAYQNYHGSNSHVRNASGSSFHGDDTSSLITNSRQVKSSLQRLERTQDELFEL